MAKQKRSLDYYAILEVGEHASALEIKRAYRKLALRYHPDRAGVEEAERFMLIHEAQETLLDPGRRAAYDREREERGRRARLEERSKAGRAEHDLSFVSMFVKKRRPARGPLVTAERKITVEKNQCVMCQGYGARPGRHGMMRACPWCKGTGRKKRT